MCDEEIDLTGLVFRPHPILKERFREMRVSLATPHLEYFQKIADEVGFSVEHLMEIYLRDIVYRGYRVRMEEEPPSPETMSEA